MKSLVPRHLIYIKKERGMLIMERVKEIGELMKRFKAHGVAAEDAPGMSLMVDRGDRRARLIKWLDENPEADDLEVLQQARKIQKEDLEAKK